MRSLPLPKLLAMFIGLALFVAACGSDESADANSIATNDGGVLVQPPDVVEGDTVVGEDGVDPETQASGTDIVPSENAAEDVAFTWFDGQAGSISQLQGTPTVLNFWATTCAACVAEMPEFEEVFQEADGKVAFVGMNTIDVRSAADRLVEQTGVTYPLAEDPNGDVFRSVGGFVMPTTIFLTADGEIGYQWSGVLTASELKLLIDEHIAPGAFDDV